MRDLAKSATTMTNDELIEFAKKARLSARPYISKFKVGAALLTKSGEVILGCNIEDPSGIGITNICAERCAVVKALSEGYDEFEKIAVAGGTDDLVFCAPCGACRQYLNAFCPSITVVCTDGSGSIKEFPLSELLPYSFCETF